MGLLNLLRRVFRKKPEAVPVAAQASVKAKATMGMVVRRWMGTWECGCTGDVSVLQPDECPRHPGHFKVYAVEDMGTQYEEIVDVPADVFRRD